MLEYTIQNRIQIIDEKINAINQKLASNEFEENCDKLIKELDGYRADCDKSNLKAELKK